MRHEPSAGGPLSGGDFGLRHLVGNLAAQANGILVAAHRC
jgi:hypothetical protein